MKNNTYSSTKTAMFNIFKTQDGSASVISEQYGVSYHSKYGAVQESRHVFIQAGLYFKALYQKRLSVLDIGFGTGLNAFMLYLESQRLNLQIDLTTVESFPIPPDIAAKLNYPAFLEAEKESDVFLGMHQSEWNRPMQLGPHFTFEKMLCGFEELNFQPRFDLVFFDAFSPETQPELWAEPMLAKIYAAMTFEAILVTYCAKGAFKRALKNVGFEVEALQGPPGKREMTRAMKR
jgi:tRNA U34 5-methylaminomethyl-2-thiouridine-forming methyltransferase MnmC